MDIFGRRRERVITNQDYLNALYGHKRIHCPRLTGLNKQQLGQLARRMGLDVVPTGKKLRPDGLGTGEHSYKQREETTWRGTPEDRELERNRAFDAYFDRRARGDMRAERLDRNKRRDEEIERVAREAREREAMAEEDFDAPAKPKPKPKRKLKVVKPEPEPKTKKKIKPKKAVDDEVDEVVDTEKRNRAIETVKQITDGAVEVWNTSGMNNVIKKKDYIERTFEGLYRQKRPNRFNRNDEQLDYDLRTPDGKIRMIMDISD